MERSNIWSRWSFSLAIATRRHRKYECKKGIESGTRRKEEWGRVREDAKVEIKVKIVIEGERYRVSVSCRCGDAVNGNPWQPVERPSIDPSFIEAFQPRPATTEAILENVSLSWGRIVDTWIIIVALFDTDNRSAGWAYPKHMRWLFGRA